MTPIKVRLDPRYNVEKASKGDQSRPIGLSPSLFEVDVGYKY